MERDLNYKITWKDWAQIIGIAVGVAVLIYLTIVFINEGIWVIGSWTPASLK